MALDLLNVFYCLFETFNKILGKANIGLGATLEDMRQAFEAAEPNETHMLLFSSHQSIKFAMGHILIPLHTHPCKKVACNHCPTCQSSCTRWKNGAIYTIGVSTSCYGMTFQIYLVNNPVRCVETFSQGFVHGDRCHHAADRHLGLDCELCSGALCMCLLFTHTQAFIGYVVIAIFIYNTIYQDISYSGNRLMVQEAPPLVVALWGWNPCPLTWAYPFTCWRNTIETQKATRKTAVHNQGIFSYPAIFLSEEGGPTSGQMCDFDAVEVGGFSIIEHIQGDKHLSCYVCTIINGYMLVGGLFVSPMKDCARCLGSSDRMQHRLFFYHCLFRCP